MIRKNPLGVSPTLTVAIDGASVNYLSLNKIEVFLEEDLHDMVILHMAGLPPRASKAYRNCGVQVTIDNGASYVAEFYGYVVEVRPAAITNQGLMNQSPFQDVQIVCLGTSYSMRGSTSKVWTDYRLQDVVQELCEKYGMSADVPADTLIMSPMVQENESDWQFLNRYAKELGYAVTVHGTHIHVFDAFKATGRRISYNNLRTAENLSGNIQAHPGQITSLKATLSENHPDGYYKDTYLTVHQSAPNLMYDLSLRDIRGITTTPRFSDRLDAIVDSYDQGVRAIEARTREVYDFSAKVECLGIAGCKPGGVVSIDKYLSEDVDGLWYVKGVQHTVTSGVFTTSLDLVRNVNSELLLPTSVAPLVAPPTPRMLKGIWSTSKQVFNVYA